MLQVRDLRVSYGAVEAVKGISFDVRAGAVVALVGSNGAGKTTTLRTVSGLLRPREGSVTFEGERVDGRPPHKIVERGVAHSPAGRRVFPDMTVEENLGLGAYTRRDRDAAEDRARVYELFPVLAERRRQAAGTLSGGEQQVLAIGRALMSRPRLLMLDEPSTGLSPIMVEKVFSTMRDLKAQGMTVLLVEQNAYAALSLADHGIVMESGRVVLSGPGPVLLDDDSVRRAYLGED